VTAALSVLSSTPVVLEALPLSIDRDEVLRFQGYKKGIDVPGPEVMALFEQALALGRRLMAPRLVYRALPLGHASADRIEVGGETLHIPQIGRLWGRIEGAGAGVCTVGDAIETRVRALFDAREFPLAVMLDSVGSAAVESLAEYANDLRDSRGSQGHQPHQPGLRGLGRGRAGPSLPALLRGAHRREPQRGLLHDPGQEHHLAGGRGAGGTGGPLFHPVPPVLDARLRLSPGARHGHGAAAGRGGLVIGWKPHG
jgi:hypothetical protein